MAFLPVSQTGVTSSLFGKVCTQFQEKKQAYTYLATLDATIIGFEVRGICTHFEEKPAVNFRSNFVYSIVVIAVYTEPMQHFVA